MYAGRIVAVGCSATGVNAVMYRVSSRSFPNRRAVLSETAAMIVPKPGFEEDVFKNPYIAYNCLRLNAGSAIAGNGSHTDPIADKIAAGMPVRDALTGVLSAMDYEHDDYNTPRIAAVTTTDPAAAYLGIVRKDALLVKEFPLTPGRVFYLCTYERNEPSQEYCDSGYNISTPAEACAYILGQGVFAELENPVTAVCAVSNGRGTFSTAVREVETEIENCGSNSI